MPRGCSKRSQPEIRGLVVNAALAIIGFIAIVLLMMRIGSRAMKRDNPRTPHRFQIYPGEGATRDEDRP